MTETLLLDRHPSEKYGTFGHMYRNGVQICVTCEPVDPIPCGTYLCEPHNGPKWQNVWKLQNVPGHTAILIHAGNTIKDTADCILVGDTFGRISGCDAILNSVLTLDHLRAELPDTFYLTITQSEE